MSSRFLKGSIGGHYVVLQVVSSTNFRCAAGHDVHATRATVAKWGFADNAVALGSPAFVQNKIAQLLAALAAVWRFLSAIVAAHIVCKQLQPPLKMMSTSKPGLCELLQVDPCAQFPASGHMQQDARTGLRKCHTVPLLHVVLERDSIPGLGSTPVLAMLNTEHSVLCVRFGHQWDSSLLACKSQVTVIHTATPRASHKTDTSWLLAVQELYPEAWPNFFADIVAAAACDAARASMFARVLLALDEDVISLEIPRSDAGSRRSMAFKDAMRERDVSAVISAAIGLVVTHRNKNPETAASMLSALQRYIDWVDINLIVTPDFMELLRQLLQGVAAVAPRLLLHAIYGVTTTSRQPLCLEFTDAASELSFLSLLSNNSAFISLSFVVLIWRDPGICMCSCVLCCNAWQMLCRVFRVAGGGSGYAFLDPVQTDGSAAKAAPDPADASVTSCITVGGHCQWQR